MKKLMMWLALLLAVGTVSATDTVTYTMRMEDEETATGEKRSIATITKAVVPSSVRRLEIPEKQTSMEKDFPVVAIIAGVFTWNELDEVILPAQLETLGDRAFRSGQLKTVTIRSDLPTIGAEAFAYCDKLQRVIFEGLPPTSVGADAFPATKGYYMAANREAWEAVIVDGKWNNLTMACWDANLKEEEILTYVIEEDDTVTIRGFSKTFSAEYLTIPEKMFGMPVAKVDDLAFYGCPTLKGIKFSEGLKEIGAYAFYRCEALLSVTIPESLEKIGVNAFEECPKLPVYDQIVYESPAKRVIISSETNENGVKLFSGDLVVPEGVWFIMDGAFNNAQQLTSVVLPEGLKHLGKEIFGYSYITSAQLPSDMKVIPKGMFYGCYSLTSIDIPDSVQSIENEAFYSCGELTSITFSEGTQLEEIGESAFYSCMFDRFEIPNTVKKIGARAFQSTGLTTLTIPDSVEEIGEAALSYCTSLTSVTLSEKITTLPDYFLSGCDKLTSFEIPATVKNIGKYAFQSCGLRELSIPATVESLGEGAFTGCQYLPYVLFEGGVPATVEGAYAAFDAGLLGAYLPANSEAWEAEGVIVDGLWQNLTMFCYNENVDPSTLYTYTDNGDGTVTIDGLSDVLHAETFEIPATVTIDGEEKTVTAIAANAFDSKRQLTSVIIPEGVTTIGSYAFNRCSALQSVTIPETVVSIGQYAFDGCTALPAYDGIVYESEAKTVAIQYNPYRDGWQENSEVSALELPDTVRVIAPWAIQSGTLMKITLPASLDVLGYYALGGNWELKMVVFKGNPPTTVEDMAFPTPQEVWNEETQTYDNVYVEGYYCTDAWEAEGVMTDGIWNNLKMFRLSDTFENADLFTYTENTDGTLTVTGLSDEVVHIGTHELPATVTIDGEEKAVTAIANGAFAGSMRIQEFILPDSVTTFGNDVFTGCKFLPIYDDIRYESAKKQVFIEKLYHFYEEPLRFLDSVRFIHSNAMAYGAASAITVPASVESIGADAFMGCSVNQIVFEGLPPKVTGEQIIAEYSAAVGVYEQPEWSQVILNGKWYGLTMMNPDLVIEDLSLTTPTSAANFFFPTDTPTLAFRIRNQGLLPSEATKATITLNGKLFETVNLPALEIDDYTDFARQYNFNAYGEYTLSVTLDSDDVVPELNEENNTQSLTFSIIHPIQTWTGNEDDGKGNVILTGATVEPDATIVPKVLEIPATLLGKPIVEIADNAFDNFTNIKTLIIPASVTSIGAYAFKGCTNLQNVIIAEEGEALTIGMEAFNGTALKSITLPARVTSIAAGAFTSCTNLKKVIFKGEPPTIAENDTDPRFDTEGCEGYYDEAFADAWAAAVDENQMWHGVKMVQVKVAVPKAIEEKPLVKKWLKEVVLAEEENNVEITLAEGTPPEDLDAARLLGIKPLFKAPGATTFSTLSALTALSDSATTVEVSVSAELHVSELIVDDTTVSLTITVKAIDGILEEGYCPTAAPKIYGRKTLDATETAVVLAQTLSDKWTLDDDDISTEATQTIVAPLGDYQFFQAISEE